MEHPTKKTAIIILNYNNPDATIACVESVERFNTAPVRYIIVDNGSNLSGCIEKIDSFLSCRFGDSYQLVKDGTDLGNMNPYMTLLVSDVNDGYACGNNKGLRLIEKDGEIDRVLILNNDILFTEDIIPELIRSQESLDDCAIISPLLLKKNGRDIDLNCARKDTTVGQWTKNNFLTPYHWLLHKSVNEIWKENLLLYSMPQPYPDLIPIELPSGSCMLIKKNLFKKIGYFDPKTFLYYEENILYRKIEQIGKRNYIDTRQRCIHLGSSTISRSPSKFISRIARKSCEYYVKEYTKPSFIAYWLYRLSLSWVSLNESMKNIIKR